MRITRKRYERHKREAEKLKEQLEKCEQIVTRWEHAMEKIGDTGGQSVVAVHIDDETGVITTECEITARPSVVDSKAS